MWNDNRKLTIFHQMIKTVQTRHRDANLRGYRRFLYAVLTAVVAAAFACLVSVYRGAIPSRIQLIRGESASYDLRVPAMAQVADAETETVVNLSKPFTIQNNGYKEYSMHVKLFGVLPIKDVTVRTVEATSVIPGGQPIGIYVETDGVLVLGTSAVTDSNGNTQSPAQSIVVKGDYIVAVNGTQIRYKSELIEKTQQSGGKALVLTLRRNETLIKVRVVPVYTKLNEDTDGEDEGVYRLGIWVRDDTQGIGTLTFQTADGTFGALGHGVSDVDTGDLLESDTGRIYQASIAYVVKGESGAPGELVGSIDYSQANQLGLITNNTACGIYGKGNEKLQQYDSSQALPIGLKSEVQTGTAVIRSAFTGQMKEYEVEIEQVHVDDSQGTPDMVIKVTDEELLSITGGIVQGLSGSPIIQNGKVIGALTHVFVKEPTKGYGIFIEDMLEQIDS